MVCQNKIAKKALKNQPSHYTTPLNEIIKIYNTAITLQFILSIHFGILSEFNANNPEFSLQ